MTNTTGASSVTMLADLPSLSVSAKRVIALLQTPSHNPPDVIYQWEHGVGDPAHPLYDARYRGCAIWGCCPLTRDLRDLFATALPHLPREVARRLTHQFPRLTNNLLS